MAGSHNFNLSPAPSGKVRGLKRQVLPPLYNIATTQDGSSPSKEESPLHTSDFLRRFNVESLSSPIRELVDNDSHPDKLKYGSYFNFRFVEEDEEHHAYQPCCGCPHCEEVRAKKEMGDLGEKKKFEEVMEFLAKQDNGIRSPRAGAVRKKTYGKGKEVHVLDDGIRSPKLVAEGKLVGEEARAMKGGVFRLTLGVLREILQMFDDEEDPDEK